jgi:hypothetical protein
VKIDPQLLQHRRFVLDDEHRRTEDVRRSVDFQARWERRKPDLPLPRPSQAVCSAEGLVFQGSIYTVIDNYSLR